MSSLVRSNRDKSPKIDRGHAIKPENKFSLDDLNQNDKVNNEAQTPTKNVDRVTFYANIRINNHIKNKLEALAMLGIAKSQKQAVEIALDYYLDSLSDEQKRRYDVAVKTLEDRDVLQKSKK
ncbi:DUF5388 domain-containing protein [Ligilactobacillus aviarius]|uniref:DUF5388 domain-containing protein n=1 Tax=Ligilactobacillus aviarius TaxID=1606 RepID=UPI0024B9ECAD|nr:DUF5388 domain-containing protein [Ligilactobacillus aviarius]